MEKMLLVMASNESDSWVDSVWTANKDNLAKERAIYLRNNTRLDAAVIAYKANAISNSIYAWDDSIQEMILDWDKKEG